MSRAPISDHDSDYYWQQVREHNLVLQRCTTCQRHIFYPRAICPHCHHDQLVWDTSTGEGTIYSFTVSRRPASPDFEDITPYVVALIDLDEGVRMLSNIVMEDESDVHIGMRVRVHFLDLDTETTLPVFAPIPSGAEHPPI